MASEIKSYAVLQGGFLFGDYYEQGATIRLNEKQARLFIREGRIGEPATPKKPTENPAGKPNTGSSAP